MADSTSSASFKVLNQDFVKFDCFDGTNFNCWKDKMMFLLMALNVACVLNPLLETILEVSQDAIPEGKAKVADLKKMSLYVEDIFSTFCQTAFMISTCLLHLPSKIGNLWKQSTIPRCKVLTFLIMKYLKFKMLDSIPILDQVHELQVLVNKLRDLKVILLRIFKREQLYQNCLPLGMTIGRNFFTRRLQGRENHEKYSN